MLKNLLHFLAQLTTFTAEVCGRAYSACFADSSVVTSAHWLTFWPKYSMKQGSKQAADQQNTLLLHNSPCLYSNLLGVTMGLVRWWLDKSETIIRMTMLAVNVFSCCPMSNGSMILSMHLRMLSSYAVIKVALNSPLITQSQFTDQDESRLYEAPFSVPLQVS